MLRDVPFIYSTTVRRITLAFTLLGPGGLLMPLEALADALTDAALVGQADAAEFLNAAPIGNFTGGGNAQFVDPKTGSTIELDPTEFFQESSATTDQSDQFSELSSSYGDDAAIKSTTTSYAGGGATMQDEAFDILGMAKLRSHPDMSADPMWAQTDKTMEDFQIISESFADCDVVTSIGSTSKVLHVEDIQHCDRLYVPKKSCTIDHPYDAQLISLATAGKSAGAYSSCGEGCYDLWVGKYGAGNYWAGSCTVYEQETAVVVHHPEAITSAVIEHIQWDDHIQVFVGGDKLYQGPYADGFPPEQWAGIDYPTPSGDPYPGWTACELGTIWVQKPNIDVTSHFTSLPANGELTFNTRVSVTGTGQGYSRIRILYDTSKIVTGDAWDPLSCAEDYNIAKDSAFCTSATATCTVQLEPSVYVNADGITFTNASLGPSPIPEISNLCKQVKVTTQCDFATGELECFYDMAGELVCPTSTSESKSDCGKYETDPTCAFVTSACVDGAFDVATGTCMVTQDTYDCGYDVVVDTETTEEDFSCPGPVRCMGSECILDTQESNEDFTTLMATMEAVKMMAMDMECDITAMGGGPGTDCHIFEGDANMCKKAIGGTANCCDMPTGVSLADYLMLIYSIYTVDQAVKSIDNPGAIAGSWLTVSSAVTSSYDMISVGVESMWTSAKESMFGGGAVGADAAAASGSAIAEEGVVAGFKQQMIDQTQQWMAETFGEEAAALFFEEGASGAMELGGPAGTIAGGVMTAYMVYQATMLAIAIIYACEESEYELSAKRELKSAHYVGSYCRQKVLGSCIEKREVYCTFSTPLARIINEQIRPIIGKDWGTPEAPQCDGISLFEMSSIDWTKVDLSEWEALLVEFDIIPTAADVSMENITGSGNALNVNGDRDNVLERSQDRLDADSPDDTREEIRADGWGML